MILTLLRRVIKQNKCHYSIKKTSRYSSERPNTAWNEYEWMVVVGGNGQGNGPNECGCTI